MKKMISPKSGTAKNQPHRYHKAHRDRDNEKLGRVYYKSHDCSMCLFKGIKKADAVARINALKAMYNDWQGSFIITQ